MLLQFASIAIMTLSQFVETKMLPKLVHKTLCSMLEVIAKVDDVGPYLYVVMFYQLVLQLIKSVLFDLFSLNVDFWLTWLFYVESCVPSHVCKLRPLVLCTSAFIQWAQLIVLLINLSREGNTSRSDIMLLLFHHCFGCCYFMVLFHWVIKTSGAILLLWSDITSLAVVRED